MANAHFADFAKQAAEHLTAIWAHMRHKEGGLPLGHDGYLKLWALSNPVPKLDYIMVDEAQDLNPVLLGVLRNVTCPVIYVGDPYQQIYDWRGAINAMDQVEVDHRVLLSQSFRFGEAIAKAATEVIRRLGAREPVRGLASVVSHLAKVRPDAILSRSNAGVIANVLKSLHGGERCYVLGGTQELERLLTDVKRIESGQAAIGQELLGFPTWKDVLSHSLQPEGEYLRGLVNLVREYGADTMLAAIARCERQEATASVVCSTAHRAKGREWAYVRVDEDFVAGYARAVKEAKSANKRNGHSTVEAETRLLYVALTRAQLAAELPDRIMERFGLTSTTDQIVGRTPESPVAITEPSNCEQNNVPQSISPYHSAQKNEPAEVAAIRRFFQ
jgi:superfamily I DNA/RNA helicase